MDNAGCEGENIGFMESITQLEDGIISLGAMLNKSCRGEVLFGVRDNGDIIGTDIEKTTLKRISETVWRDIDPSVIPVLNILRTSDGKEYISMKAQGKDRPYFVKGCVYIRCGEENRKASHQEAKMMLRASEDCLSDSDSANQNLTFVELCLFLKKAGIEMSDDERLHHSLGLLNNNGIYNMQAELLSDQNRFPLTVVRFKGVDRTSMSYRTEFSKKSLLSEVTEVLDAIKSIDVCAVTVSGGMRAEQYLFDFDAFKEAWVNACVHNNWLSTIPPTVHIFDDRIEVISYGSIPYWLTMEDFYNGRSMPVNESLMRVFIQTRFSEHSGHGIPKIVKAYGKKAFTISPGSVSVTIRFSRPYTDSVSDVSYPEMTEKELLIFDAIRDNPNVTIADVSRITGTSTALVSKTVKKLRDRGIIVRRGSRKSGHWEIIGDY